MNEPRNEPLSTADIAGRRPERAEDVCDDERFRPPQDGALPQDADHADLLPQDEMSRLRDRWNEIQGDFVNEPRRSVEEADALVASAIQRLADSFANARTRLEGQWTRGGDVSTEDLRLAFRQYRSFFDRLLAV